MKSEFMKSPSGSLKFIHPQNRVQKMSLSQYDEEPTIMFLASNRQSLQSRKSRFNVNHESNRKFDGKLKTYESNLMQSSPQRSQNSVTDGQFVCNYLTPIKKQQFHKLLFKDEINESPQSKTKVKFKSQKDYQFAGINQRNNDSLNKNNSKFQQNHQLFKMIESFLPCQNINKINQVKRQFLNSQKSCNCQPNQHIKNQHSGVFIDPCSQINFLKLNNQDLFSKLQKQIQKNSQLQSQNLVLQKQNQKLISQNILKNQKITKLQDLLKKYQDQRNQYLAKQLEQFKFVKEILFQKRRSKSKEPQQKNQSVKRKQIYSSQQKILRQTIKQQSFINFPKAKIQNEQNLDSKQTSFCNFTNRNRRSTYKAYTVHSQFDNNQCKFFKKGKTSQFQNKNTKKRLEKQNQNLQRFLKEKLQVNFSYQKSQNKNRKILESHLKSDKQNFFTEHRKRAKTMNSKKS